MNHLKEIAGALEAYGLDAMLLTSQPGEFYAVGFHGEGTVLVSGGECRYYTDPRYTEAAGREVSGALVCETGREQPLRCQLQQAVEELGIARLGFEQGYMTVAEHERYAASLSCALAPAQKLVDELRAVKDGEELERMEKAQAITDEAFSAILEFLRPGVTEQAVAARLQYEMLRRGAQRMSFDPIVVTGPNGSLPHGVPGERPIAPGSFVTMDFGCVWGGYCSDMTRTVAVGEPTAEMRKVYHTVLEAQRAGIAASRAGLTGREVDAAARGVIDRAGYGAYFTHSYGHSLGIEIHESPGAGPGSEQPIPAGAVISAEPGIYLPGRFGVRIEDVVVFTPEGCRNLTKSPKELIIV